MYTDSKFMHICVVVRQVIEKIKQIDWEVVKRNKIGKKRKEKKRAKPIKEMEVQKCRYKKVQISSVLGIFYQ